LASNILDHNTRQQAAIPNSSQMTPVVINRVRIGNHFRVYRRRKYPRCQLVLPSSIRSVSRQNSSEINLTQPSSLITDQSRESLINLCCLFQDNINSSKSDLV